MTTAINYDFYFSVSELNEWESKKWIKNVLYQQVTGDGCVYTANYLDKEIKILVK